MRAIQSNSITTFSRFHESTSLGINFNDSNIYNIAPIMDVDH